MTGLLSFLALLSFIAYLLNSFAIRGFFRQTFELIKKLGGWSSYFGFTLDNIRIGNARSISLHYMATTLFVAPFTDETSDCFSSFSFFPSASSPPGLDFWGFRSLWLSMFVTHSLYTIRHSVWPINVYLSVSPFSLWITKILSSFKGTNGASEVYSGCFINSHRYFSYLRA